MNMYNSLCNMLKKPTLERNINEVNQMYIKKWDTRIIWAILAANFMRT